MFTIFGSLILFFFDIELVKQLVEPDFCSCCLVLLFKLFAEASDRLLKILTFGLMANQDKIMKFYAFRARVVLVE